MISIIPELNYYFSIGCRNNEIDFDYQFKYDDYFYNEILYKNSFLHLLFCDNIDYDEIIINFEKYNFDHIKTLPLKRRLSIYENFNYFLTNINGNNIFELNDNDILFLNILLDYKKQIYNYNIIQYTPETPLSKLIYFYVEYMNDQTIHLEMIQNLNYNDNEFYYILCNTYNLFVYKTILNYYK